MLRKIRRALLAFLSFGFSEQEEPADEARGSLDRLRSRLDELKTLAAKAAAQEYNLERDLAAERAWLERLESGDGEPDVVASSRVRVGELEQRLGAARECVSRVHEQVSRFQEELRNASGRIRDAQVAGRLAELRIQAEKIAFDEAIEEDLAPIQRIEHSASKARAEAEAAAELNAALGIGEPDSSDSSPEGRADL